MSESTTLTKLYTGEGGIDFVGKRRKWYITTAVALLICIIAIALRGFNLGIDFVGGTKMNMPAANLDTAQVEKTFTEATGVTPEQVQVVGSGDSKILEINSERLSEDQITKARTELYEAYKPQDSTGKATPDVIGDSTVSEAWGSTITNRMLISMVVFLIAVFVYIAIRLQKEMAVAAIAALFVDLIAISGIYAICGFEVSPASVIGLLTVLAFSLYDTVIVFDKVRENTAGYLGTTRKTYAEHANLAINQTVMRSISTTVISVLPIIALMVIAVWLMGVGTLKDLALVQFIGVLEGTLSSVFLATPILVDLKNRTAKTKAHNRKVTHERLAENESARPALQDEYDYEEDVTATSDVATSQYTSHSTGASWRPNKS
ncbi:protein translocase subunit SecF [Corynebacterium sp. sy039]|uniref:protein translocase subunit SecF n=1 Tax=Corynebacterium sp. sy039 TaxID=2599641 RepID=UPI0011B47CF7|nr:protein translocase subunit SecF [Corynebacterium sp. sy039]QDZ43552.1 protein translocase subunit SecF [Corynebacterium sp. sy039]